MTDSGDVRRPATGLEWIAAERQRQKDRWPPELPGDWDQEELVWAAACYLLDDRLRIDDEDISESRWPWPADCWVLYSRIKALAKAGGYIAAEIDRILAEDPDAE